MVMALEISILVFLVGLCFGSFITMASYRMPRDVDWVTRRSHCPLCEHPLRVIDLLPVVSWMMSSGKCRYCGAKVSARYVLIELMTGGVFVWLYLRYGLNAESVMLAGLAAALITLMVADLETGLIPDQIHWFLLPLGALYHWYVGSDLLAVGICLAVLFGTGLLLHYGYYWLRGFHGLGFGDVKFLAVAGMWLGDVQHVVPFLCYSGLCGIVTGLLWKVVTKEQRFPFGPALAISLFLLVTVPSSRYWLWYLLQNMFA